MQSISLTWQGRVPFHHFRTVLSSFSFSKKSHSKKKVANFIESLRFNFQIIQISKQLLNQPRATVTWFQYALRQLPPVQVWVSFSNYVSA